MRGWARKGPWGPEVDALAAACGWVRTKPLDRHGLTTPLELKLPQAKRWDFSTVGKMDRLGGLLLFLLLLLLLLVFVVFAVVGVVGLRGR